MLHFIFLASVFHLKGLLQNSTNCFNEKGPPEINKEKPSPAAGT